MTNSTAPRIFVTTVNAEMSGFEIANGQDNRVMRDGNTTGIYEQTRAVNEKAYTLTEFRRRFDAETRKKMIADFLCGDDIMAYIPPSDLTAREWERRLMDNLRSA
jgi:hypothetical protein